MWKVEQSLGDGPNLHVLMGHPERRSVIAPDLGVVIDDHIRPTAATVRRRGAIREDLPAHGLMASCSQAMSFCATRAC